MADDTRIQNGRIVGRYVLYEEIASGGMATVRLGRLVGPVGFARTVAIKQLRADLATNPEFVAMFVDEARVASHIRHPNVVPTLDVVALGGELLLVMDYVAGETLSRLTRLLEKRGTRVPPPIASAIVGDVLHGLHAAHEARGDDGKSLGVVHRDVSPQNVIVGADGVTRVLDFGIAKALGRLQTTREGQLKGKAAYMAPEQIEGRAVDRRADVYAASVVLWETLTGERLFRDDGDMGSVFERVLQGSARPPSELVPGLPKAYDAITMRGLARRPEERFATAREMARALERETQSARASEVSEWLETIAAPNLAVSRTRVASMEARPPEQTETDLSTRAPEEAAPAPPPARRTRRWILVAAAVALALLTCVVYALRANAR